MANSMGIGSLNFYIEHLHIYVFQPKNGQQGKILPKQMKWKLHTNTIHMNIYLICSKDK